MSQQREQIQEYIHQLSNVSNKDLLVDCDVTGNVVVLDQLHEFPAKFPIDSQWKKVVKIAQEFTKQADINTLCLVHGTLRWMVDGKEVNTPVVLTPLTWKIEKVTQLVAIDLLEEYGELNPFLRYFFKEQTGKDLELDVQLPVQEVLAALLIQLKEENFSFQFSQNQLIGNLHYHRFHLLRELEGLLHASHFSQPLSQVLGNVEEKIEKIELSEGLLVDADRDQLELFSVFENDNVVLHGPPGTGKSQVIVNMIGKALDNNQRLLIVSEKRVALEVLVKKLEQLQLGDFAFIAHSQSKSKEFLKQLENTWLMLENTKIGKQKIFDTVPQRISGLQLFLDRLNQPALLGGVSFSKFNELALETPYETASFFSGTPNIAEWLRFKSEVQEIDALLSGFTQLHDFKVSFLKLDNKQNRLAQLRVNWEVLSRNFGINSYGEFASLYEKLGRCQLIENEYYKPYTLLANKKKERIRFEQYVEQFRIAMKTLELLDHKMVVWKSVPSLTQIEHWKTKPTFFQRKQRAKEVQEYLATNVSMLPEAIAVWEAWWEQKQVLNTLELQFLAWGLEPNLGQIEGALYVFKQMDSEGTGVLAEVAKMSTEARQLVLKNREYIQAFKQHFQVCFSEEERVDLSSFLLEKERALQSIFPLLERIQEFPVSLFTTIQQCEHWSALQAIILKSNRLVLEAHFPALASFKGEVLLQKVNELIDLQQEQFETFAAALIERQAGTFQLFEQLLRTPSNKLSADEKARKARLKKGKSLLVKEFGKTRNLHSIRDLLESDAREWIQTLIPIWLSTPNQVADHFPLEQGIFDWLIIDEASQMPLPKALGALYRSNRVLIAGDEQQMSPTNFFGKQLKEHDVLHQAGFYLSNTHLFHHYRSVNAELISFSNQHFYQNKLLVYPAANQEQAVFHHLVEQGVFTERCNVEEAKALVKLLHTIDFNQSIGIVAFSKEQLYTIWDFIPPELQEKLREKEEQNTFFLKSLEEVQGDEARIVLASLGYGKQPDGTFPMRFGPLNHESGFKRLNVLLTRAISKFHFFTSVKAADFGISANENINLLRQYLLFLEGSSAEKTLSLPHAIQPNKIDGTAVFIQEIESKLPDVIELMVFVKVMKQRGWNLKFI